MVALLGALAWLLPRAKLETDIMALLPRGDDTGIPAAITEACVQRLNQQLVWLVAAPPGSSDTAPAQWWLAQLQALPEIAAVSGPADDTRQADWAKFLFHYRAQWLDPAAHARLDQGPAAWAQWVVSQVYSPFAGVGAGELQNDPLLLTRSRQLALQGQAAPLTLADNWPTATDAAGRHWRLMHGELHGSSFDLNATHALVEKLAALRDEFSRRWPGGAVLQRGTIFYSDYAAARSQADIAALGSFSCISVILVILLFFRSFRPFLLTLLSTGIGTAAGVVALLVCFDTVHLVALVLSTSVIGVAVDYALHYLTEHMMHGDEETPLDGMRKMLPTLALALLTSSLAYLALAVAPFPGFRQLAVYAVFGLTGAFLTVALWFPILARKLPRRTPAGSGVARGWLRLWRERAVVRFGIPVLVALVGAVGFIRLQPDDDIARLQGFPPSFQETEKRIGALTGQSADMNWYVVRGDTAEATLQRVEQLEPRLARLQSGKKITGYRLLTGQLPSLQHQRATHARLAAAAPAIAGHLRDAGLDVPVAVPPFTPLTPDAWLASPVSDGWRLLWFAPPDGTAAALVPVSGVADNAALAAAVRDLTGVHWLNRRAELSALFSAYRQHLGQLLGVALGIIGVVFMLRFGVARGLRTTLPVLLALGAALGTLALTGQPLNLFALLALVLVLGIGIDYTLFFANDACAPATTMMAVFIDALTTLLSFGMLAFSATPAIAGFGVVLTAGIFTAFLLAPLAQTGQQRSTFNIQH